MYVSKKDNLVQIKTYQFKRSNVQVVGAERVLRGIVDVASSGHMTVRAAMKISSSPLWCTTATWHMTRSVHSHANIYIYGPILQVLTTTSIHLLYYFNQFIPFFFKKKIR